MSRDTTELIDASHVVSMSVYPTAAIPKGSAVIVKTTDYTIYNLDSQDSFTMGVTMAAHAAGVKEEIPVCLPGPVIRVIASSGVTVGDLVNGDALVPGEWLTDVDDAAGFALETAGAGEYFDMCFIGEQH